MKKSLSFIAIISLCAFAGAQGSPASAQPQAKAAENTASQFGKSYVRAEAGIAGYTSAMPNYSSEIGTGAFLEFVFNACEDDSATYGLNIAIPLEYYWGAGHSDGIRADNHAFYFPLHLRPYYKFNVSENLTITPFITAGAGGLYRYQDAHGYGNADSLDFFWIVGAGVEFTFFKDFAFAPRYDYDRVESNPASYEHIVAAQFAWKFAKNMALIAEYQHIFLNNLDNCEDIGRLGVRFEF